MVDRTNGVLTSAIILFEQRNVSVGYAWMCYVAIIQRLLLLSSLKPARTQTES